MRGEQAREGAGEIELSLVCPVFNEGESVALFFSKLRQILDGEGVVFEVIFVDDGSRDNTWSEIEALARKNPQALGIRMVRNYGKEVAVFAGVERARGLAVIPVDVDFQDPLELIPVMVELWRNGHNHVVPRRRERQDTWIRRFGGRFFYNSLGWLTLGKVPKNVGDFRLIDAGLVKRFLQFRSKGTINKIAFAEISGNVYLLDFVRPSMPGRKNSGQSVEKLVAFFLSAVVSNSERLLRIILVSVSLALLLFGLFALAVVLSWLLGFLQVPGQATVVMVGLSVVLVNVLTSSFLALLLTEILREVQDKPKFLVDQVAGDVSLFGHPDDIR